MNSPLQHVFWNKEKFTFSTFSRTKHQVLGLCLYLHFYGPSHLQEIWCMTIPNWADKNFPLSSPENPICHHSQFILPLICTDHHLIVPLLLWRSQPLGPWTHLLSAGLSTHQNQIIYHDQGDEGISNNQRNQPHWLILAWTSSSYSQRRSKPLTLCSCHLLASFQTIIWYPIIFQLSSPYIYELL